MDIHPAPCKYCHGLQKGGKGLVHDTYVGKPEYYNQLITQITYSSQWLSISYVIWLVTHLEVRVSGANIRTSFVNLSRASASVEDLGA